MLRFDITKVVFLFTCSLLTTGLFADVNRSKNIEMPTYKTTNYTWDAFGHLTQAGNVSFQFDPLKNRSARLVDGVITNLYVYNPEGQLVGEINKTSKSFKRFVYASKSHVPDYFIDETNSNFKIITDQLGSVRLVVNAKTGEIVQEMRHDEFGRVLKDTNPGYQPFGFAGGIYDSVTKLVRFGAREYDSEIGRWLSKDPIRFNGSDSNLYGYVLQDPVNGIDPSGLDVTVNYFGGGTGHIGVSVNNGNSMGYYGSFNSTSSALSGFNGSGSVLQDSLAQRNPATQSVTIHTSPSQDSAVTNYFNNLSRNPGQYNLYNNNCTTQAGNALNAAGISTPNTSIPYLFINGIGGGR